jgi:uncharacterized membrane protein YbhN (UPF0104 family)
MTGDQAPAMPEEQPAEAPRRSPRAQLVRRAFAVAVVAAIGVLLWRQRDEVVRALGEVSPGALMGSMVIGTIGVAAPVIVWRVLLAAQGYRIAPLDAARTFFLGQLGKYVPGGIWSMVAQVDLARDLRVPARQAATATLLTIALSVVSGLVVAALTLPLAQPGLLADYWWVFAVLPLLLLLLHPRVVEWWTGAVFRILRRPMPPFRLDWGVLLRSVPLLLVGWVAFGLHFGLLVRDLGEGGSALWLLSTGLFALSWIAGLLVVVAPAGAGVREGVLVLGFAGVLPPGAVLTVALLSRLLLLAADVVLALLAVGLAARSPRRRAGPPPRNR